MAVDRRQLFEIEAGGGRPDDARPRLVVPNTGAAREYRSVNVATVVNQARSRPRPRQLRGRDCLPIAVQDLSVRTQQLWVRPILNAGISTVPRSSSACRSTFQCYAGVRYGLRGLRSPGALQDQHVRPSVDPAGAAAGVRITEITGEDHVLHIGTDTSDSRPGRSGGYDRRALNCTANGVLPSTSIGCHWPNGTPRIILQVPESHAR